MEWWSLALRAEKENHYRMIVCDVESTIMVVVSPWSALVGVHNFTDHESATNRAWSDVPPQVHMFKPEYLEEVATFFDRTL